MHPASVSRSYIIGDGRTLEMREGMIYTENSTTVSSVCGIVADGAFKEIPGRRIADNSTAVVDRDIVRDARVC
jgi:hypothetical protein